MPSLWGGGGAWAIPEYPFDTPPEKNPLETFGSVRHLKHSSPRHAPAILRFH